MRDARQISAREVSQGVQRHVLDQTTGLGSTVMAHSGAAPLVFERLTARSVRPGSGPLPGSDPVPSQPDDTAPHPGVDRVRGG